jgi:hypothetical protein
MKVLKVALPLVLLLLPMPASSQQYPSVCAPTILPADVSEWLKNHLPSWRIKTTEDLEDYHRRLWKKNQPDACPGIASGHFSADGAKEFTLLLVPKNSTKNGYKVIAFTKPKDKPAVTPRVIEDEHDQNSKRVVIYRVSPGLYKDPENARRVRIERDGIVVEAMEAGASLYFWRKGRLEHLIISE